MPVHYYTVTNSYVEKLVDTNSMDMLEKYIDAKHIENVNGLRLYHVLSCAVDVNNNKVLKHFINRFVSDIRPDGNSYDLLVLAIEKYVENYSETHHDDRYIDTIKILCEQHKKIKKDIIDLGYATRHLISHIGETNNYDLLDLLVLEGANLWDIYHYSIAWNNPSVFDKLLENYVGYINFGWTESAINQAYNFDHNVMAVHVLNKMNKLYPEEYEKIKHLLRSTSFIIKSEDDIIPESVTDIKTSFEFSGSIDKIKLPQKLIKIVFGPNFNQSLANVSFPPTLETIGFGLDYNWTFYDKSIKDIKFPKSLKVFYNSGCGCNESIDDVIFPDSLETLRLGYQFNHSIDKVKWPKSLKKIQFGCNFDQSLEHVKFPKSLETLEFSQTYKSTAINTITHPITTLKLLCIKSDITKLPSSLKNIAFYTDEDRKHTCKLPEGCQVINYW
jgi:hypothetical protein